MTVHIRIVARTLSAIAVALIAFMAVGAAGAGATPVPVFARSIEIIPEQGVVLVAPPGARPTRLHGAHTFPVGTTLDVTHGTATLVSASPRGAFFTADISAGEIRVVQRRSRRGATDLVLAPVVCGKASAAGVTKRGPRAHVPSRYGTHYRRAFAAAASVGRFRLVGRYQTAENVGPKTADWLLQDLCAATTAPHASAGAASAGGAVGGVLTSATDNTGAVSTAARGGKATSKQAAPGASGRSQLSHGETWLVRCSPTGQAPISRSYCETLFAKSYPDGDVLYTPSLFSAGAAHTFDLCIDSPAGQSCRTWAFSSPSPDGSRAGLVTCTVSQVGDYSFSWEIQGIPLGLTLPAFHATQGSKLTGPCDGDIGAPLYPVGSWSTVLLPNTKIVNEYNLPTAGWLGWLSIYLQPTGTAGKQPVQGVVYQDAGGAPGALVGTTTVETFSSNDPAEYLQLFFEPDLYLPAGNYWFGVLIGGRRQVARFRFEKTAELDISANTFAAGPSDPFGQLAGLRARMSMHIGYSVDPPPSTGG